MNNEQISWRFFSRLLNKPILLVVLPVIFFITAASFIPKIIKDTRGDAFLSPENPALLYRERVREQFGLNDPVVVAIKADIYTPAVLQLLSELTSTIQDIENIKEDKVFSLATEKNMSGNDGSLVVEDFLDPQPTTKNDALLVKSAIQNFPLYNGSIVSKDGDVALIIAELWNQDISSETYKQVNDLAAAEVVKFNKLNGTTIESYVAGEGAIAGYLGEYIDNDMKILNPIAGLIIFTIVVICFSAFSSGLLALMMIATTVLSTIGIMAASGVSFYVITNALPVILIGIAVADTIHILGHYFELQASSTRGINRNLVIDTMAEMWRPVTLTSLTTIAGFAGLYLASDMPPFKFFGLFAAIGVALAWVYSMTLLPAVLILTKPKASKRYLQNYLNNGDMKQDIFSRFINKLGALSLKYAKSLVVLGCIVISLGAITGSNIIIDEDRIDTFNKKEDIYKADKLINGYTNGANNLDIIIETNKKEGLFSPTVLRKIEALQEHALVFDDVTSATSIVDYLKQMNMSLNNSNPESYVLPKDAKSIAQYFLIYSASGESTDFDEEVDYDYKMANVRFTFKTGSYHRNKDIIENLQQYISQEFNDDSVTATMTGRVTVDYFWIRDLGAGHFFSLGIALILVFFVSALMFRSMIAGVFTLIPVCTALLFVYATMAILNIPLGIGASMFASIAIGLGVDFSIHTIDRIRELLRNSNATEELKNKNIDVIIARLYPSTGRALLFNFIALACGFGVLIASSVVPLNEFGSIVVVAVVGSFLCSMTLLPALIKLTKPDFIHGSTESLVNPVSSTAVILVVAGSFWFASSSEANTSQPQVDSIVANIINVNEGDHVTRSLKMRLINKQGKERISETTIYRRTMDEEKRTLVVYNQPSNVKGTAFLTYDYQSPEHEDDQWLYLPATKKSRRISASNRGDYFLGTDFTYEDIKNEGKMELSDYNFTLIGSLQYEGLDVFHIKGIPKSERIADELGYSRNEFYVDKNNWIIVKNDYWDGKGKPLKTIYLKDLAQIQGIWSRKKLVIENHKTGHTTEFEFSNINYDEDVPKSIFDVRALSRR
ncbi:MAG: putative RND superfamily exporter protein [Oceanicoccus sp.]|jgi:predicted RND superfamily exporter protein